MTAGRARAQPAGAARKDDPSVLVDVTRCIGCRSCERACARANHLTPGLSADPALPPSDLTFDRWTAVRPEGGAGKSRFVKRQCLHCLEPACVAVCPVAALYKTDAGPVIYRESRCIGCRYCMIACPFDVPRFEWSDGLTPVIGKCQFCAQERLFRGLPPACVESCPTGALKFGRRSALLGEAHARLRARPDRYVDRVFGEAEVGGTSWLYLSDVPFEELGFKKGLPARPLPSLTWDVVSRLPALVTLLASLFAPLALSLSRREDGAAAKGKEKVT
jgi:Fe-S-cluster-containing dehydrogenase component